MYPIDDRELPEWLQKEADTYVGERRKARLFGAAALLGFIAIVLLLGTGAQAILS